MYFELGTKISQLGDDLKRLKPLSLASPFPVYRIPSVHIGYADTGYKTDLASSCLYSSITCTLELIYLFICLIGSEFKS